LCIEKKVITVKTLFSDPYYPSIVTNYSGTRKTLGNNFT